MGEYIKYKGQEIKLGTCESLYYTTYADLEKALENAWPEERKEIAPYMDEKEGYLFRFPFADETPDFGGYDNCDRVFRVVIPRIFDTIKDVEYIHETIFTRKDDVPGFSYGFKSPCPASTSDLKIFDMLAEWNRVSAQWFLPRYFGQRKIKKVIRPYALQPVKPETVQPLLHQVIRYQEGAALRCAGKYF